MKNRNNQTNINQVDQELKKLQKRKHDLIKQMDYRNNQNQRKERARRLIETGALAEKFFELHGLDIADREELFKMFSPFVVNNKPKKFKDKQTNTDQ